MKIKHLLLLSLALPVAAHAWWNEAWTGHRVVTLDTSATGVEIAEPLSSVAVPVRLHSGNFDFLSAKPDGSDLRAVAADDKTPLKLQVERFDAVNELGLVWVQVPQIAPKTADQKIHLYFGNPEAQAEPGVVFDPLTAAAFHFEEGVEVPRDASANGNKALGPVAIEKAGLLGASARFEGQSLTLAGSPTLALAHNGGFTFSAWVRASAAAPRAVLYRQGGLAVVLDAGKLSVEGLGAALAGGAVPADSWHHVAFSVGSGQAALYVDGNAVVNVQANLAAQGSDVVIGEGFMGLMDEVVLATAPRPAAWIKAAASLEGAESAMLAVRADEEVAEEGGGHSYFGVLIDNLTVDAWVVIVILMVMFFIAAAVMVAKAMMISRTDKENRGFLARFRAATHDFLALDEGGSHPHSSLFRLYQAGLREVRKRADAQGQVALTGASIDAIKAAVDADMVRETHKLNAKMVMLTIAISGGPFLGLLGTVVGVMITFAAIAAAGDVNVNAIAPGIAAALLATVAGLGVAIPALFGYNYLASRIKNISADMQIFVDEFITRIAESHGR